MVCEWYFADTMQYWTYWNAPANSTGQNSLTYYAGGWTVKWKQAGEVKKQENVVSAGTPDWSVRSTSYSGPENQYTNYSGTVAISNALSKTVEYEVMFTRTDTGVQFNKLDLTLGPWHSFSQTYIFPYPWSWRSNLKFVWDDNGNPIPGPGGTNDTPNVSTNNPTPGPQPGPNPSPPFPPNDDPINRDYPYPTNSVATNNIVAERQNTIALLDALGRILDELRRTRQQQATNNSSFNDSNIVYALTNHTLFTNGLVGVGFTNGLTNTLKSWLPNITLQTTNPVITLPFSLVPTGPMEAMADQEIDFGSEHLSPWCVTIRAIILAIMTVCAVVLYVRMVGKAVGV